MHFDNYHLNYEKKKKLSRIEKQMVIENAMVINLAIGVYEEEPTEPDIELQNCVLSNLEIDKDLENLNALFGPNNLNYTVYPKYTQIEWTQKQIIDLLQEKAKALHNNLCTDSDKQHKFDGLFVAISCHGFNNKIITSDLKLIDNHAIHRIFSTNFPESRKIPRIFIYDCCDGSMEYNNIRNSDEFEPKTLEKKTDEKKDKGKHNECFETDDIAGRKDGAWQIGEKNPDHKLVEIHAANKDYQSKLNTMKGSYMIYEFVHRQLNDLNGAKKEMDEFKYLHEHLDEIERVLEDRGKQKITKKFSDLTQYIVFKKNPNRLPDRNMAMEMKQIRYSRTSLEWLF
eukprot:364095_1